MKLLHSRRFAGFVFLALISLLAVQCSGGAPVAQPQTNVPVTTEVNLEPVKVGVNLAVTGPGAINSVNILNGIKLAAEEANAAGGVLGGRRIKLIVEDNKCIPSEGVSAQNKLLYQDKVSVTLGLACSSVGLAAMPIIQEAQIPNVGSGMTNDQISEASGVGGNEWMFRTNPPDGAFAAVGGKVLVEKLGYKTFAGLVTENDWGHGVADGYTKSIEASGGTVKDVEFYTEDTVDYVPIVTKLKDLGVDSVFLAASGDPSIKILSAAEEIGWDIPWSGQAQYFTQQVYDALGTEPLENATQTGAWYPNDPSPESKAFIAAFMEAWGYEPPWPSLTGYVSMKVVADAIERAGSDDPAAIRDALKTTNLPSPLGPVQYDDHNQNHARIQVAQMKNGELTVVASQDW
jgi:branched-chain amino acid transport system substrate-binding protein